MKSILITSIGAATLAIGAIAAPSVSGSSALSYDYRQEYLPADTTLIAHVDLANFRRSIIGSLFMSNRSSFELDDLDELTEELGFDPMEEVNSVTLFGGGQSPEPGTIVIVASSSIDSALFKLRDEEGFEVTNVGDIQIFSFDDAFGYVERRGDERIIVVAKSQELALASARVLRGEAPSMADSSTPALQKKPVDGSFLFLLTTEGVPGLDGGDPASQILALANGLQLDIGESGSAVFANAALSTGSVDAADDVADIAQAFLAIARMSSGGYSDHGDVGALLRAVDVNAFDGTVSINFAYPISELAAFVQSMSDQQHGDH